MTPNACCDDTTTLLRSPRYLLRRDGESIELIRLADHARTSFTDSLKEEIESGLTYIEHRANGLAPLREQLFDTMCDYYKSLLIVEFEDSQV